LVAHARRVIEELEHLDGSLGEFAAGVRGQVRLLANTSAIVQFLASDIAAFLERHPTVKIDLEERTSEQIQRLLLEGLADVGILVAVRPDERLVLQPYQSDQLVVMLPKGHPLARRARVRFADTLAYVHVGLPRGSSLCESLMEAAKALGKPLKLRIQATSFDGLRKMVSAGLGVGVLPWRSVVPYLEVEGLVARPLAEPWAQRTLTVATRERHLMTRVARLLAEHLAARHEAVPDGDG
jgi:DNA-binding transcriptional LysR family regulator